MREELGLDSLAGVGYHDDGALRYAGKIGAGFTNDNRAELLAAQADARAVDFTPPTGQAAAVGWQILPGDGDLDGMYYAVVEKLS